MHCRPAELSDLEAVVAAWERLAREQRPHGSRIDPAQSTAAVRERLAAHIVDGGVAVAEEGVDVVGFVVFHRADGPLTRDETLGFVSYLFVDPAHRERGIGRSLLANAENCLAERGVETVELEVLEANAGAIEFYRARGYRPHRRRLAKSLGDE